MKAEDKSHLIIDSKLKGSGWAIQDMKSLSLTASLGVAVREFPKVPVRWIMLYL